MDGACFVFVDETGATTAMTRLYGWGPRGERLVDAVPAGHWKTTTFVAGLRRDGVIAPCVFDGPMTGEMFRAYVEQMLAPRLGPGDVVVMDNLAAHKGSEVERLIRGVGAEVRYLPAYSPDFNPIEKMFSKLKAHLRKAAARSVDRLIEAMGDGLRSVTHQDIAGWFRSCGYSTPKRKPL